MILDTNTINAAKYALITTRLNDETLLRQVAEEAAELGQAALKMIRTKDDVNPTPVTATEARAKLSEEIGDVLVAITALVVKSDALVDMGIVNATVQIKPERWLMRILEGLHAT